MAGAGGGGGGTISQGTVWLTELLLAPLAVAEEGAGGTLGGPLGGPAGPAGPAETGGGT